MEKPIKVGVIGTYTVIIEGYLEATSKGYSKEQVIVEALEKAGIIEIVNLDEVRKRSTEVAPEPIPTFDKEL